MPRAIADSDDEEDDLFAETNNIDAAALKPSTISGTNAEVAIDSLGEDNEKSTGSTETLRRQIQSAERGLLTNSASEVMRREPLISSDSPSVRANKRRNSIIAAPDVSVSSQRSAKRTKTTHTYGSKHQTNLITDEVNFQHFLEDDVMPQTSQSARFTEHSGLHSSAALPSGPIHDDFVSHEPNLMFRDSGSTVADTSSAQQRLLEQARARKLDPGASDPVNAIMEERQNSSIPWSTLERSNNPNGGSQAKTTQVESRVLAADIGIDAGDESVEDTNVQNPSGHPPQSLPPDRNGDSEVRTQASQVNSNFSIALSPAVEIPRDEATQVKSGSEATTTTKKTRLGRMRKAKDNDKTEPLISDDRPVGLPEEQYKPRPSKRRATQTTEEPVDYSVRPEKAAKAKRSSITSADAATGTASTDEDHSRGLESATPSNTKAVESASEAVIGLHKTAPAQVVNGANAETEQSNVKAAQEAVWNSASAEQSADDEIILVPPKSTQKSKAASKSKKSRPTILEDDELSGSHPEPSPSQRQAQPKKKSPLQDVQNEAKPTQRKRRKVVSDDEDDDCDDDEDKEDDVHRQIEEPTMAQGEDTAPKKRGRGRPPKSTVKPQPKVVEKCSVASDENDDNQTVVKDGSKKGKQRKPGKANEVSAPTVHSGNEKDKSESFDQTSHEASECTPNGQAAPEGTNTTSEVLNANQSSGNLPTPSPEKRSTAQKDTIANPTSRSSTTKPSGVKYRVGLSQRARIPPLHRNIKPQKR